MGKRTSTPEIGTVESTARAVQQSACKSLVKKKEKVPEMLFYSMVRKKFKKIVNKRLDQRKR